MPVSRLRIYLKRKPLPVTLPAGDLRIDNRRLTSDQQTTVVRDVEDKLHKIKFHALTP
jgi:hypothetical protein